VARWSADRWRAISPHLDRALELNLAERQQWLAEFAGNDPDMAKLLRELLLTQQLNEATGFLERSPLARDSEPEIGQQVGSYELVSRLGNGGTGSVWLARRSDGHFESTVAIKVLDRRGLARQGDEQVRREAGLLAQQSHANTAKLFDAGFCENGQPYLVLEYVQGRRIDEYCSELGLTLPERLELLLPIVEAVAHAHARQIVHCDLKPSNVLVTTDGVAKLLDFGVASLISRSLPLEAAVARQDSPLPMSPGYASPEQIRGEAITPASDVYALGMMLHVLLTGQHPYISKTKTSTQMIRATLTDDAAPASTSIESGPSQRWVRGDLDAVIAKAIERQPERRYPTAMLLAADLKRFLACRPVSARQHTLAQRFYLYIRRLSQA
jgi:eukaryotic-like serine/threonine-protein kinase